MSMSLRDQLLAAGLVSQKQVRDAERQQQHEQRGQQRGQQKRANQPPQQKHPPPANAAARTAPSAAAPGVALPSALARQASAQSAKVARDLELNRRQQEKAQKKARAAQIRQLIEQNRVPRGDTEERYNFVDGGRVRFISANADIRRRLIAGELVIVRHERTHEVVPAAIGQRIRERDEHAVISAASAAPPTTPLDDAYKGFEVPDDLMW